MTAAVGAPALASTCSSDLVSSALVPPGIGHNELLGGHGRDTIHAGPSGDVLWGDSQPSRRPSRARAVGDRGAERRVRIARR